MLTNENGQLFSQTGAKRTWERGAPNNKGINTLLSRVLQIYLNAKTYYYIARTWRELFRAKEIT